MLYLQDVGVDMQGPMCMCMASHFENMGQLKRATGDSGWLEDNVRDGWSEFERIRAEAGAPITSMYCKCRTLLGATASGSEKKDDLEDLWYAGRKDGK